MKRVFLWMVFAFSCFGVAAAKEMPRHFQGIRPLGMGGAFLAVSDDANALFYNPAGLDKTPQWGMSVVNPFADGSKNARNLARDIQETDFDVTEEVIELIRTHIGEDFHIRAGLFPNFYRRHFALGVLAQAEVDTKLSDPPFPETVTNAFGNVSGLLGAGFGFKEGMIRVGATAKYVKGYRLQQVYDAADITASDFENRVNDDLKDGAGFGLDVGAMVECPVFLKPTLSLVVQNVGDVDLGDAGEIPQQIHLGLGLTRSFSWFTLTGAADWRDVTNNAKPVDPLTGDEIDEKDLYKHLHFGLEARLPKVLSLRAGLYQGYGTFGGTLDLWVLKIDAATYAEELGAHAGQKADRRYAAQLTVGW